MPQPSGEQHGNVIRGQFERRGQTDWAVLCSRAGASRLLHQSPCGHSFKNLANQNFRHMPWTMMASRIISSRRRPWSISGTRGNGLN